MFVVELLDPTIHDRNGFYCANATLTRYLHIYANQDLKRNLAKIYVAVKNNPTAIVEKKKIYGYFSLSAYSLCCYDLPAQENFGGYPQIPAILLGRLAIQAEQRELFGYTLLARALKECKSIANQLGARIVVVDAIDDRAETFYIRQGFERIKSSMMRLYFPIKDIP